MGNPIHQVPETQSAAVKQGSGDSSSTKIVTIPVQKPGPGQLLVKINYTGLCASDKSLIFDEWNAFGVSMGDACASIAGHEGAGVVVAMGEGVQGWKEGDRAGIKWIVKVSISLLERRPHGLT